MECDKDSEQLKISQDPKFSEKQESIDKNTTKSLICSNTKNNNRYVAPVGVLILLLTFYILILIIQQNFNNLYAIKSIQALTIDNKNNKLLEKGNDSPIKLSTSDINEIGVCYSLDQLFVEDVDIRNSAKCYLKPTENIKKWKDNNNTTLRRKAVTKAIKSSKNSNGKNGSTQKMKKSVKVKPITKKDQSKNEQKNQKSYAAEPIIYIFAIVFIYLLLKAASDINQHYKSQSKGDKRFRRCSLQSYAQAHKQDRRFSKGTSTKNLLKV
ncbi:uncharacterized protein LOC119674529 [Teleopsis dalmanni]|uniref:uncharacterized protein LOC119674529 n=1 Tax=Teleopsis dalmanni TaxID=139649 RepID=UPI0018CDB1F5|nr:uncharacterized protein LOC119674529 [Teleopsis dalmanni]